jgi:hypothetical protein
VRVIATARRIADNSRFQHFIVGVILVGAIAMGVETSATLYFSSSVFIAVFVVVNLFVAVVLNNLESVPAGRERAGRMARRDAEGNAPEI